MIQKFLPAVADGDKRIILVDGEAEGRGQPGSRGDDIRSNMVRGGAAKGTELTAREREICAAIGPELRRRGLLFVGIDVIDGYLTEINVTSPTGIRAIKKLGGPDLAVAIWDAIEAKANQGLNRAGICLRCQTPMLPADGNADPAAARALRRRRERASTGRASRPHRCPP